MTLATLDKNGIAIAAGYTTVFNFDTITREHIGQNEEYLMIGVGIPAYSCIDAPYKLQDGFTAVRNIENTLWEQIENHRGKVVYSTKTGEEIVISELGKLPHNVTEQAPTTQYDRWNGNAWETDKEAKNQAVVAAADSEKQSLLLTARQAISIWQTELLLGIISDSDKASLITWLTYIKELEATDTRNSPITWPQSPTV